MRYNAITSLPDHAFSTLVDLKKLSLARNQISFISPGAFHGLRSLIFLDLNENQMSNISAFVFEDLHSLIELYIGYNSLSAIDDCALNGLLSLRDLVLCDNRIEFIQTSSFEAVRTSIKTLDLANNNLNAIEVTSFAGFDRLSHLYLTGSQLKCTCQVTTILRSLNIRVLADCCFSLAEAESLPSEVFTNFPQVPFDIYERRLWSTCDEGCDNSAYVTTSLCDECIESPHFPHMCVKLDMEKNDGVIGKNTSACTPTPCLFLQYCNAKKSEKSVVLRKKSHSTTLSLVFGKLIISVPLIIYLLLAAFGRACSVQFRNRNS